MDSLLDVEHLSFWYPSSVPETSETPSLQDAALKDVSLRFDSGEFVLLVGPSGSGKSTLIQALLGVVPALTGGSVAGRVLLEGEPVLARGLPHVAGRVGLVLQDPESQLTNLDVEGEVVFGPENLGLPRAEIGLRLEQALSMAGVTHLRNRFVYALSGGQKQRVAIAAGLAMRPRALLLDSPTSNLDPLGSAETLGAIVDLWRAGATELILMAAHKIDEVLEFATRLIVLDNGRIRFDGRPHDILRDHRTTLRDDLGIFVPELFELAHMVGGTDLQTVSQRLSYLEIDFAPAPAPAPREAAVEVRDLHFAYRPDTPVLRGISLTIGRGEFLALLGQNGTGKTTLAKNIAGLYRPSRGSIHLGGRAITNSTLHLRSGRVGYVFQYPDHQFVALTVADELGYGLRARGLPEDEVLRRIDHMLEVFELGRHRAAAPYGLSMGEKRRLSVATMLVLHPEVLILDEPTTGQDRHNTLALMRVLRSEARERGTTIIQITHDMEQAAAYADRAVVMDDGRIVFDGLIEDLFAQTDLLRACHLAPTPTSVACARAWPSLARVPSTPEQLERALRPALAGASACR